MIKAPSVGIVMVATNDYLNRWFDAASSLEQYSFKDFSNLSIHLFTNRKIDAQEWASRNLRRFILVVHQIDGWGWPEATLYRYRFVRNSSELISEEILMYLDSDMLVSKDFSKELFLETWQGGLAFVQHPGYFRNSGVKGIFDYLRDPKMFFRDIVYLIKGNSGIGAWEDNKESSSFVDSKCRKTYVHGAVWFGKRKEFLELCKVLSENVDKDLERGYIARWHDESHLNWYFSNYTGTVLDVRFSSFHKFKNLRKIEPFIYTVEKVEGEGRERTEINQ